MSDSSDDEVTEEIVFKIPEPPSGNETAGLSVSSEKTLSITAKVKSKKSKMKSSTSSADQLNHEESRGDVFFLISLAKSTITDFVIDVFNLIWATEVSHFNCIITV